MAWGDLLIIVGHLETYLLSWAARCLWGEGCVCWLVSC